MSSSNRVRRNTLFKILGEASRAFSVLLYILIARFLGGSEFGSFSVALALATFFAGVADGGLNQLMIRDVARDPNQAKDRTELTFGIKIFMAPLFLISLVGFMALCRYPPAMVQLGFYCGLASVGKSGLDYCYSLFSGYERMQYESVLKAVNQFAALALGTWILVNHGGISAVVLAIAAVNAATFCVSFLLLQRQRIAPSRPLFDWSRSAELAKEAFPLTITVLFNAMFIRIDIVMLSLFHISAAEIGQFAAGTRVIEAIGTIPMLLTAAVFPVLADQAKNLPILFIEKFRKGRLYFMGIASAIAAFIVLLRDPLVHLTFGLQFTYTSHLLAILAISLPAIFLNYWYLNNLVILEDQRTVAIGTVIALAANALANVLIIPRWGAAGASISMVFGQFIMCCIAHFRLLHFQDQIQSQRMMKIKDELKHFYHTSEDYYRNLDACIEEQLEHYQFGRSRLSSFLGGARSILEVGCGSGILLYRLKGQYPDKKMSGVDLSPIGIEMARRRAREGNLNIEYRVADVETTMPFPAETFDFILCNEVLEHLTNPEAAIRTMCQMLAPGGLLVLVFPNHAVRAPLGMKFEKLWDTLRMVLDRNYIHPRFVTPTFDQIGADADATYITHPWEVQRMVKRSGLHFLYRSLVRGRLIAQK